MQQFKVVCVYKRNGTGDKNYTFFRHFYLLNRGVRFFHAQTTVRQTTNAEAENSEYNERSSSTAREKKINKLIIRNGVSS
jgi:hypothetical protein